jgi:hypothetical protein
MRLEPHPKYEYKDGYKLKKFPVCSQTSEQDCLDENAAVTGDARQTPHGVKPFLGQTCTYTDSSNR